MFLNGVGIVMARLSHSEVATGISTRKADVLRTVLETLLKLRPLIMVFERSERPGNQNLNCH